MNKIKDDKKQKALHNIKFFLWLNLGLVLTAVSTVLFKTPNHFALGGTSGMAIILASLFPNLSVGSFLWVLNGLLVVLGLCFLGRKVMGWTVYASLAISAFVSIGQKLMPLTAPLTQDTLLELCFAVLMPAAGSAIVFNIGASTGGTDIIAMILSKFTSLEIGKALLVSDLLIVLGAAWIYGPATGLYCILGLVVKSFAVDGIIENINLRKVCTVVTTRPDEVKAFILSKLHRSATVQTAYGAYSHREEEVLVTVLTRRQAALLRNFLRGIDPDSFLTIVNSSEIIGKGFQSV